MEKVIGNHVVVVAPTEMLGLCSGRAPDDMFALFKDGESYR